jgi:hypothetical protein
MKFFWKDYQRIKFWSNFEDIFNMKFTTLNSELNTVKNHKLII